MTATVTEIRGKTEQRVAAVVEALRTADAPMTYEDLGAQTSTAYDVLLYIMATLTEVGMVERHEVAGPGPGRPKVQFTWMNSNRRRARALGAR